MTWLLWALAAVVLLFVLAPALFKSSGSGSVGEAMAPPINQPPATVIRFQNTGGGTPLNRYSGSLTGYMGVVQ